VSPSSIVSWLEGLQGPWAYIGVFVVAFAEHALFVGTFVPGEVILARLPYRRFLPANALALTAAILTLAFWRLRAIGADLARASTLGDVRDA
jgi:hypothetical protein